MLIVSHTETHTGTEFMRG